MKKRRYLLAASLLLLLLSAGYGLTSLPEQAEPAMATTVRKQSAHGGGKAAEPQLPGLNLALLQGDETAYRGSKANLFRSLQETLPTRPAPVRPLPKPEPPTLPETAAEPPTPLPPPLVYMGQLRHGDRQTVFLRQDDEVFLVHEGERFGRQQEFRVAAIYPEVLMLDWDGSDIPVYIPLANSSEGGSGL
jgi:hypothetical protein